jgi:hypothetical protein
MRDEDTCRIFHMTALQSGKLANVIPQPERIAPSDHKK